MIEITAILSTLFFKLVIVAIGFITISYAYRLFAKGIFGQAGTVKGQFRDNKLLIKKAAPGTLFLIGGVTIVSIMGIQSLKIDQSSNIIEGSSLSVNSAPFVSDDRIYDGGELPAMTTTDGISWTYDDAELEKINRQLQLAKLGYRHPLSPFEEEFNNLYGAENDEKDNREAALLLDRIMLEDQKERTAGAWGAQ